jgi:hypothetical protein
MQPANYSCCTAKRRLAEEFAMTARQYAEIVANLSSSRISKEDQSRLFEIVREAQNRAEDVFARFEQHLNSHQCWDDSATSANG